MGVTLGTLFRGITPGFSKILGVHHSDYILKSKIGIHGPAAYAGIHEPLNWSEFLKGRSVDP